jgi:hypothetical protein
MTAKLKAFDMWDVVRTANAGDQQSLARIEQLLAGPESKELPSKMGDLSSHALESILQSSLGTQELGTKAILIAKVV